MLERYSEKAIMAKARAMYGKSISESQFTDMINCKSVSDIAGYLKNETHFAKSLEFIKESSIHRGHLEMLLNRDMFERFAKLYRYSNIEAENMFKYVVLEEEIDEVFRMIKLLKSGQAHLYILQLPSYLISKANIDFMALAKVRSYKELLRLIEREPMFDVLNNNLPKDINSEDFDIVECEYEIYGHFFDELYNMIEKNYHGEIKKQILELVNLRIELLSIQRIYRSKAYYNMSPEQIEKKLYKKYYKLNKRSLNKLIYAKSIEEFQESFMQSKYSLSNSIQKEDFDFIEHMTRRIEMNINKKYLRNSMGAEVSFYAFVLLSKIEISNIINIIEGVRYNIPKEEIQSLINI